MIAREFKMANHAAWKFRQAPATEVKAFYFSAGASSATAPTRE